MPKFLRPLFCRVGSKVSVRNEILQVLSKVKHDVYVEPFVGGGTIFWSNTPAKKNIINDLDKTLMNAYRLIKKVSSNPNDFPSWNSLDKAKRFFGKKNKNINEKLSHEILATCGGFGSQYATKVSQLYKGANPARKTKNIVKYKERMKNTTIKTWDYKRIIKKYDSKNTLFFLDPPYEASKGLYKDYGMDYPMMAKLLKKIKGKFLLTINDSQNIREVFKTFFLVQINVRAQGNVGIGKNNRGELFVTNFKYDPDSID